MYACMCVYTCINTHTHTYTLHTNAHTHTHTHTHKHTNTHTQEPRQDVLNRTLNVVSIKEFNLPAPVAPLVGRSLMDGALAQSRLCLTWRVCKG